MTPVAFMGGARDVTIEGLTVEKYASPLQRGAIAGGPGWRILNNLVQWNHGIGIGMGANRVVEGNRILRNGQMGIGGTGSGSRVTGTRSAGTTHGINVNPYWEAGGTKFTFTNGLLVDKNWSHHNGGPGLWTDIDNINITSEENLIRRQRRGRDRT